MITIIHAYPLKTDTQYILVNDAPFHHAQSAGHDPTRSFANRNGLRPLMPIADIGGTNQGDTSRFGR